MAYKALKVILPCIFLTSHWLWLAVSWRRTGLGIALVRSTHACWLAPEAKPTSNTQPKTHTAPTTQTTNHTAPPPTPHPQKKHKHTAKNRSTHSTDRGAASGGPSGKKLKQTHKARPASHLQELPLGQHSRASHRGAKLRTQHWSYRDVFLGVILLSERASPSKGKCLRGKRRRRASRQVLSSWL